MNYTRLLLIICLGLLIIPVVGARSPNNEIIPEVSLTIATDLSPGDHIGLIHVTVTSNMASTVTVYLGATLYTDLDLSDLEDSFILDTFSVPNGGYVVVFDGVAKGFTTSIKVSINIVNDYDPPIIISNISESIILCNEITYKRVIQNLGNYFLSLYFLKTPKIHIIRLTTLKII